MAKSTVNMGKRTAEMQFYAEAEILVTTPAGEGVFYGMTHSRNSSQDVLAKVCYVDSIVLVPLSDVKIVRPGGAS